MDAQQPTRLIRVIEKRTVTYRVPSASLQEALDECADHLVAKDAPPPTLLGSAPEQHKVEMIDFGVIAETKTGSGPLHSLLCLLRR